jgi:hypothetical protein
MAGSIIAVLNILVLLTENYLATCVNSQYKKYQKTNYAYACTRTVQPLARLKKPYKNNIKMNLGEINVGKGNG